MKDLNTFPDKTTSTDLHVNSWINLNSEQIAEVFVQASIKGSIIHRAIEAMDEEFEGRFGQRASVTKGVPALYQHCTNDYHYTRQDEGIPMPVYGDYNYIVVCNRCHDTFPLAKAIIEHITGDTWRVVSNYDHTCIYHDDTETIYDFHSDGMTGGDPYLFPYSNYSD